MIFNLAVIGSGPSGSISSLIAARKGLNVVMLEKKRIPRDKFCGGGLTSGALKLLKDINVIDEMRKSVERYIEGGLIVSPKGKVLTIEFKGKAWIVNRRLFDWELSKIAVSEGAILKDRWKVKGLRFMKDYVEIISDKGEKIRAEYVIDGSGVEALTIKKIGIDAKRMVIHALGDDNVPCNCNELIKVWKKNLGFIPLIFAFGKGWGYFWLFLRKAAINAGYGTLLKDSRNHTMTLKRYLRLLKKASLLPTSVSARIGIRKGWLIPIPYKFNLVSPKHRVLLVGDAGGVVHPLTGEGIYGALISGNLAANNVKKALDKDDPSLLHLYEKDLYNMLGDDYLKYGTLLARLFYTDALKEFAIEAAIKDEKLLRLVIGYVTHVKDGLGKELYAYLKKRFVTFLREYIKRYIGEIIRMAPRPGFEPGFWRDLQG